MKLLSALFALINLAALPLVCANPASHGDPYKPVGTLDVDKNWVRTGMRPVLTWEIRYPSTVDDVVEVTPTDRITTKQRTEMDIRVVGAAFQVGSLHTPLSIQTKVGTNSWEPIFLGTDSEVTPDEVVYSQIVEAGQNIDFAARASNGSGAWFSSRDTLTENPTIIALKNGDPVPNYVPAYQQGDISSFLSQYISPDNRVTIGPRDVIYLFELYSTDTQSSYFDLQDLVVVVTFKEAPQ